LFLLHLGDGGAKLAQQGVSIYDPTRRKISIAFLDDGFPFVRVGVGGQTCGHEPKIDARVARCQRWDEAKVVTRAAR
jgi:hypothetical protein